MPKFMVDATVSFSAITLIEADSLEDAKRLAEDPSVIQELYAQLQDGYSDGFKMRDVDIDVREPEAGEVEEYEEMLGEPDEWEDDDQN